MITTQRKLSAVYPLRTVADGVHALLASVEWLIRAYKSYRTKRHLCQLSDRQLRDIGIDRHDIAWLKFSPTRTGNRKDLRGASGK